jgi:hypothetical protein
MQKSWQIQEAKNKLSEVVAIVFLATAEASLP